MSKITKDNLFKPNPSRSESKSATTDKIARAIIDDEATRRERKTDKLRQARLAKEAKDSENPPPATKPKKKTGKIRTRTKK